MAAWRLANVPEREEALPQPAFTEASMLLCGLLTAALAGAASLWLKLAYPGRLTDKAAAAVEALDVAKFKLLRTSGGSVSWSCSSTDPRWRGTTLRIRFDHPDVIAADASAARRLGGHFAAPCELVHVPGAAVAALEGAQQLGQVTSGALPALRTWDGDPPSELHEGPVLVVELRPGSGLLDMYGVPGLYSIQEDSSLRRSELARESGRYNPQDLYSARPDRVKRALGALAERPQGRLRVLVDGQCLLPQAEDGHLAGDSAAASPVELAAEQLGLARLPGLVEACSSILALDGAPLLAALRRAHCGATSRIEPLVRQLREVQQQHGVHVVDEGCFTEAFEAAMARGFWTLPADESGMYMREREADRLLERARRELWVEGSASRRELEAQMRNFLIWYQLGTAAVEASLKISLVRSKPRSDVAGGPRLSAAVDSEEQLKELRYSRLPGSKDLWWRLDLVDVILPAHGSAGAASSSRPPPAVS